MKINFLLFKAFKFFQSQALFTDVSGQGFLFFPHIGKVKQIHTHKGHSDKSLFLL